MLYGVLVLNVVRVDVKEGILFSEVLFFDNFFNVMENRRGFEDCDYVVN